MTASREDEKLQQLARKIDPRNKLLRTWALEGGVSAQVTALEVEQPGGATKKMIVRLHGDADREQNPHIAADEFKLLQLLQAVGMPAPKPYYLDESCDIFLMPCIVVEFVEGAPEFAPSDLPGVILQLATQLARIHHIDYSSADLSFLPKQDELYAHKIGVRPLLLDESLDEGRIRDALESVGPLARRNKPVLLHGDFWPGNILWRDSQIIAVIDWEDAKRGDPLSDLASSRLEVLWAYGMEAMHTFTQHYKSITTIDFTDLPYWDLYAALRPASRISEWAGDPITETRMREGHRLFIEQAFQQL